MTIASFGRSSRMKRRTDMTDTFDRNVMWCPLRWPDGEKPEIWHSEKKNQENLKYQYDKTIVRQLAREWNDVRTWVVTRSRGHLRPIAISPYPLWPKMGNLAFCQKSGESQNSVRQNNRSAVARGWRGLRTWVIAGSKGKLRPIVAAVHIVENGKIRIPLTNPETQKNMYEKTVRHSETTYMHAW